MKLSFPCNSALGKMTGSLRSIAPPLATLLGIILVSLSSFSQTSQGTIQGAIFDQSGGAIAGATVTVSDVARGVTRTLSTDKTGFAVRPADTSGPSRA